MQYNEYAPIPRVAFYDITFPANRAKYEDMVGFGLLLVTALVQDKNELPIARTYFRGSAGAADLVFITSVMSEVPDSEKIVAATFGKYRTDALYLFPLYLRGAKGELVGDFARNRKGFVLGKFPLEAVDEMLDLPLAPPTAEWPSNAALVRLISRELPIFVRTKSDRNLQ
ncbi:MAG: hypothetical protein ACE5K9_03635 [Candidatus Methylomirabilales bacterium]